MSTSLAAAKEKPKKFRPQWYLTLTSVMLVEHWAGMAEFRFESLSGNSCTSA